MDFKETSTLITYVTSLGGEKLKPTVDFSDRDEIRLGGQTLTGTPTVTLLDENGVASTAYAITSPALDVTNKKVTWTMQWVSASPPSMYLIVIQADLSGGEHLMEGLTLEVQQPKGSLPLRCSA